MKYLIISLIFSIVSLINASKILSPKEGDKWKSGDQLITWEYKLPNIETVNLFLVKRNMNPPLYTLLDINVDYKTGKSNVKFPRNMLPGHDYSVLLTGVNPYNVYAESQDFSIIPSDDDDDDCYKYLYDDGSSTLGPTPSDNVPTSVPEFEPESTIGPEPPLLPDDDCDDCEDCSEDDECGECFANERCECDGCEPTNTTNRLSVTDDSDPDGTGLVDAGSMNRVLGLWLILIITLSSILFL
ncbi:hypothetical protein PMAC_001150 [Pneumocystis sp. 'macacae']|nr:hypothetical protein PMAC_001150 [Pneumocystis sp. 'macacae']